MKIDKLMLYIVSFLNRFPNNKLQPNGINFNVG